MSEEDLNDLVNLDKEDLQKVQRLINKLLDKKDNKPKRSRKKVRAKKSKQPEEQKSAPQSIKGVKKRSKRKKEKYEQERRGCRAESMNTKGDRPNTFLDMGFEKMHKKDVRIDKLLAGDNEITPRGRVSLITVNCQICGNEYDVPPSVVYIEDGDPIFTCNKCQKKG